MSSESPSRVLVSHSYARDRHLPSQGEIILLRLSQALFGPGSIIGSSRNLPSRSNRYNYHHAVVMDITLHVFDNSIDFTVCPMPAYSCTDPGTGLSSTDWLLNQANDFQQRHIPVPYEEASTRPQPPFPTPAQFGEPLFIGGWKNTKPSWVQAMPQKAEGYTTTYKCFQPPVKLSTDELRRLNEYCGLFHSPIFSSSGTMSPFPPGGGAAAAAAGGPDLSPAGGEAVLGSGSLPGKSGGSNHHGGTGPTTSRSLALQALYSNNAVKRAFADIDRRSALEPYPDDDSDDEDEIWEDNMDPITFARYYAASNPLLAKIVQEHDEKMRERLDQGILNWVEEVQSETF